MIFMYKDTALFACQGPNTHKGRHRAHSSKLRHRRYEQKLDEII